MLNRVVIGYTYRKLLTAAVETIDADLRVLAKDLNLTTPQYNLLFFIFLKPGYSLSQLADLTLWNVSNVMHVVDNLSAKGLATKQIDPNDQRLRRVYITEAGKEKINKAITLAEKHCFQQAYDELGAEKILQMLADMYNLVEILQGPEYVQAIKTNAERLTEIVEPNTEDTTTVKNNQRKL